MLTLIREQRAPYPGNHVDQTTATKAQGSHEWAWTCGAGAVGTRAGPMGAVFGNMGGCFAWDEARPRASHATHTEPPPHSKAMAYTKMYATATVRNTAGAGDARCGWGELLKKYAGACPSSDRSCHCSVARSRPCWPRPHFHSASQHPPTAVRKPTKRQATAPGRTQEAGQHTRQHPSPTHKIRSWAGTLGNTLPRARATSSLLWHTVGATGAKPCQERKTARLRRLGPKTRVCSHGSACGATKTNANPKRAGVSGCNSPKGRGTSEAVGLVSNGYLSGVLQLCSPFPRTTLGT